MGNYSKSGTYASYNKRNKEREATDFYATPPKEVANILDRLVEDGKIGSLKPDTATILEPACGAGHMIKGIRQSKKIGFPTIIGTDIKEWISDDLDLNSPKLENGYIIMKNGDNFDFLSDDYPFEYADYIVMNPPFSLIEDFVAKSLNKATKGVLMLARLQFLEGEKRFNSILKDNPPSDVYIYVDRIFCYKNGDFSLPKNAVQAYAWFWWDMLNQTDETKLHWIRRVGK